MLLTSDASVTEEDEVSESYQITCFMQAMTEEGYPDYIVEETIVTDENGKIKLPTVEDVDGCIFVGWALEDGTEITDETVYTADTEVWAVYEYAVDMLSDDGDGASTSKTWTFNGTTYDSSKATSTYEAGDNATGYFFETDSVLIIDGTGTIHSSNATDTIKGAKSVMVCEEITTIAGGTFQQWSSLAYVALPESLTEIAGTAFFGNGNLVTVSFPNNSKLTTIGSEAFKNCGSLALTSLPDSITTIGSGAFENCSSLALTKLPSKLTEISERAFRYCGNLVLTELPSGIKTIGGYAFQGCQNLKLTKLPSGLETIGGAAFQACYYMPLAYIPDSVTSIGGNAFQTCYKLQLKTLPSGITTVPSQLFDYTWGITEMTIPDGVTTIEHDAFNRCYDLETLVIPKSVTEIGTAAFKGCSSLKVVQLPEGTTVATDAFDGCNSELLILTVDSNGDVCIKDEEYKDENIESFTVPKAVTKIGNRAFYGCTKLTSITMQNTITSLGTEVFRCENKTRTKVYNANETVKAYNWAADNRIVEWDEIQSISATYTGTYNGKTGVLEGKKPDIADFEITANTKHISWGTETTETLEITDSNCSATDASYAYTKSMTINETSETKINVTIKIVDNYDNLETTTTVDVPVISKTETGRTLQGISVKYSGAKVTEGSVPEREDITVTGTYLVSYDNNTTEKISVIIPESGGASTYDLSATTEIGEENIATVTYGGCTATFTYTGVAKTETGRTLQGISVKYSGAKVTEGSVPKREDITVTGTYLVSYDNDTTEEISVTIPESEENSTYDLSATTKIGKENIATVTYDGYTATFTYTGVAKAAESSGNDSTDSDSGNNEDTNSNSGNTESTTTVTATQTTTQSTQEQTNDSEWLKQWQQQYEEQLTKQQEELRQQLESQTEQVQKQQNTIDKTLKYEETSQNLPYIANDVNVSGWELILTEIEEKLAQSNEQHVEVTVEMNGASVVPSEVLENISAQNVTVVFDMGQGITWSIEGMSVSAENIAEINLAVTEAVSDAIPVSLVQDVSEGNEVRYLSLAHEGDFGFTATLTYDLGAANAGLYAKLFYYDENAGQLELICRAQIDDDGKVEFTFTHASQYLVVIEKEQSDREAHLQENVVETATSVETNSEEETEIESKETSIMPYVIICIIAIIVVVMYYRKRRQQG